MHAWSKIAAIVSLLALFSLMPSCFITSGADVDENEKITAVIHSRLAALPLEQLRHGETVNITGSGGCYLPMKDSRDPRTLKRAAFSPEEAMLVVRAIAAAAKDVRYSRSISVLESYTGKTRFVITRFGRSIVVK